MNSELRGTRIFHRYHQEKRRCVEDRHRGQDVDDMFVSPPRSHTRRSAYTSRKKTKAAGVDSSDSSEPIKDDLTLGHYPHPRQLFATERDPLNYEASPASARSFRIVSLDGCYEENVSPLYTDSSSAASSRKVRNVSALPKIPQPPPSRVAHKKRNGNLHKSTTKAKTKSLPPPPDETFSSEKEQHKLKAATPAAMKTRRSSHSRSRFVFDGNLSLGAISPTDVYAGSPDPMTLSPPRPVLTNPIMMKYPHPTTSLSMTPMMSMAPMTPITSLSISPMTPITPPLQTFSSNDSIYREEQQNRGRQTPPPTPTEQRRRNRAISAGQYQELVLDQILQEQQPEGRHFRHAQLGRQQTW